MPLTILELASTRSADSVRRGVRARTIGEGEGARARGFVRATPGLGRILRPAAETIQDNTLGQAYRATNLLGMGAVAAKRWAAISSRALPQCLDAVDAGDAERLVLLDQVATYLNELRAAGF